MNALPWVAAGAAVYLATGLAVALVIGRAIERADRATRPNLCQPVGRPIPGRAPVVPDYVPTEWTGR